MKVLIVGAGIAGPTMALWLTRAGHEVTLVEHAPELRTGGISSTFGVRGSTWQRRWASCLNCGGADTCLRKPGRSIATVAG